MRKAGEITFADAHKHRRYEGLVTDCYAMLRTVVSFHIRVI